jgi:DNA-binding transcriptional LysR family regulator
MSHLLLSVGARCTDAREVALQTSADNRRYTLVFPKWGFGVGGMDRLTSMAVFKRTVESGTFAAAARHFGISPEMAGNHVRALEAHLGVRLLNRSTRRLHLTEAGGSYYERCNQILAAIEEAEAEATTLQATPRGQLRIASPVTFGVLHIAPAVGDYMTRYPEVTIDVAVADRFANLIEEGFDLAIRIGELEDSGLVARRLTTAQLVACAAPAYLRRAGTPKTPADLRQHACLIYTEIREPQSWRFRSSEGKSETVRVSGPLTATNAAFVHRMALAGHGVVLGPSFSFGEDIAAGRLVPLLTDWHTRELSIYALYPHRAMLSAKVRTFVDFLVERFGPERNWEGWRRPIQT